MKKQQVADLKARFDAACAGVIVDYKGISVADDTKLRKELREAGVKYTVTKNTLIHLAIDGTELQGLDSVLEGTTAVATSEDDYVAAARILGKYAEGNDNFRRVKFFLRLFSALSTHRWLPLRVLFRLLWIRAARKSPLPLKSRLLKKQHLQQRKPLLNNF